MEAGICGHETLATTAGFLRYTHLSFRAELTEGAGRGDLFRRPDALGKPILPSQGNLRLLFIFTYHGCPHTKWGDKATHTYP